MTRDVDAALKAALAAGTVRPVILFEGQFVSGRVNLWTGIGTLSWAGKSWTGIGTLGGISKVEETADIKAAGINLTLSGCTPEALALALGECRNGQPMQLWFGAFDIGGTGLLGNPSKMFRGRLDVAAIHDDPANPIISITAENLLIDLERSRERRYTPGDQHIEFPNDRGFDHVASLQLLELHWGP